MCLYNFVLLKLYKHIVSINPRPTKGGGYHPHDGLSPVA